MRRPTGCCWRSWRAHQYSIACADGVRCRRCQPQRRRDRRTLMKGRFRASASLWLIVNHILFFLAERVVDLLLDVAVVLAEELLLLLGQQPERHAHDALRELDVQPVLPVLRAARNVETQLADARAVVADV